MIALCRDAFILGLIIYLLCNPPAIANYLEKSGLDEVAFLGVTAKRKVVAATNSIQESQATIGLLKQQLDSALNVVNIGTTKCSDTMFQRLAKHVLSERSRTIATANSTQEQNNNVLISAAPIVRREQAAISSASKWGVVYGADISLSDANYEVMRAAKMPDLPKAEVFLRQGIYRSVIVLDNRDDADAVLENMKTKLRERSPYIVVMDKWCPDVRQKDGYQECP